MTPSTVPSTYGDPFAPGLLRRLPAPPRTVALLRASRIGDFLCAVPAFRALRATLPEAEIAIITLPLLCELALRSPYLDRVIPFPGFPGIAEQFFDARRCVGFFQEMQAERFDLAIQMQGIGRLFESPHAAARRGRHRRFRPPWRRLWPAGRRAALPRARPRGVAPARAGGVPRRARAPAL